MKIVHIASECAPVAKAGGLGDVVQGLSRELSAQGHQVIIILPFYGCLKKEYFESFTPQIEHFEAIEGDVSYPASASSAVVTGCKLLLLDAEHPKGYFQRDQIYGYEDDIPRFLFFNHLALQYLHKQQEYIDIVHLHDWHTAIIPILYKDLYQKRGLRIGKHIFTIHNLEYQGKCGSHDLDQIGLRGSHYLSMDQLQDTDPNHSNSINLLKSGILYSNAITTVSPTYAQEILEPKLSFGLDAVLRAYRGKLTGILNGIDSHIWSPSTDRMIPVEYSKLDTPEAITRAKLQNKHFLQNKLHLQKSTAPLIVCISRLVPQKGPEMIQTAITHSLQFGAQFVLLGSSPISQIQATFNHLKKEYKSNPNVHLIFDYNETISHLIFAAADFLVMPSIFEPCGLSQLIALSYGTIPIVRETGGLKDTVFDINSKDPQKNGITFQDPTPEAMKEAIDRALKLWKSPKKMDSLRKKAMNIDSSWKKPCSEYLKIYSE